MTVDKVKDAKKVAQQIAKRKEILAVEFLDKKKVFGEKASLDEMSSFKSKVVKQDVMYDPEVEAQKLKEQREKERMEKEQSQSSD